MRKLLSVIILIATLYTTASFEEPTLPAFTAPINLSNNTGDSIMPQMLVVGNDIYAVWSDTISGKSDIFFAKSANSGATFETQVNLPTAKTGESGYAALAESENNIYVVWQSFVSNSSAIYLAKSSDGGSSFDTPVTISDTSVDAAFPQIATSGKHVYVVWLEKSATDATNLGFAKSDDYGSTFGKPVGITHHSGNSGIPKIASEGNNVYLMWEDNSRGDYEVFLEKSNDYGSTLGKPVNVSDNAGNSGTPQIQVSNNDVYAVWMDNSQDNYEIFFAKSVDGGTTFSKPVNISNNHEDSGYPQFTVSGDNIYVAWTTSITKDNYDVLYAKSNNAGLTFSRPIDISNDNGASGWPQIAVDGHVYISWVDNTPRAFDIFIAKSAEGGSSFEPPVNISNTKEESYFNKMDVTDNTIYMVWQEANQGKHDIVFSKSTTFVPEFGSMVPIILVLSIISIIAMSYKSHLQIRF